MKKVFTVIVLLCASPAAAQQQAPVTAFDRMSFSYGQCVGMGERQVDQIVDLQKQLVAAQARVKELEPKKEPDK